MVHACYGMGCPWEDSRGECRWHRGAPYPCRLEELEERERAEDAEEEEDDADMD